MREKNQVCKACVSYNTWFRFLNLWQFLFSFKTLQYFTDLIVRLSLNCDWIMTAKLALVLRGKGRVPWGTRSINFTSYHSNKNFLSLKSQRILPFTLYISFFDCCFPFGYSTQPWSIYEAPKIPWKYLWGDFWVLLAWCINALSILWWVNRISVLGPVWLLKGRSDNVPAPRASPGCWFLPVRVAVALKLICFLFYFTFHLFSWRIYLPIGQSSSLHNKWNSSQEWGIETIMRQWRMRNRPFVWL